MIASQFVAFGLVAIFYAAVKVKDKHTERDKKVK
jgi:hypothetical protein